MDLDQRGSVMAEYIWTDGQQNLRSKVRTMPSKPESLKDLPIWNFDGSSTGHSTPHGPEGTDVYIIPRRMFPDPLRGGDNMIVICDTYDKDFKPHKLNNRFSSDEVVQKHINEDFWFGMEQEYSFIDPETDRPFGWPRGGYPSPQGPYYCGNGAGISVCRQIHDAHLKACLFAGIKISGTNAEVMMSQWEFQVGPCRAEEMGDHLWAARILLLRIAEEFNVKVSFHPKVVKGDWNGAGLHTNVSNKAMREDGGLDVISSAIDKLEKRHDLHMIVYGLDNHQRLTGELETGGFDKFNWGVALRNASVRIPAQVFREKKGYFEDRRPASNADPYQIVSIMIQTICEH